MAVISNVKMQLAAKYKAFKSNKKGFLFSIVKGKNCSHALIPYLM
jgi:hypothetical protein